MPSAQVVKHRARYREHMPRSASVDGVPDAFSITQTPPAVTVSTPGTLLLRIAALRYTVYFLHAVCFVTGLYHSWSHKRADLARIKHGRNERERAR